MFGTTDSGVRGLQSRGNVRLCGAGQPVRLIQCRGQGRSQPGLRSSRVRYLESGSWQRELSQAHRLLDGPSATVFLMLKFLILKMKCKVKSLGLPWWRSG